MAYEFPPTIRALIEENLAHGRYDSVDQVLEAALHVLSDYHASIADIRSGMNDFDEGRSEPLGDAMNDVRSQLGLR